MCVPPRARQREREEAPHRPPPGLGARASPSRPSACPTSTRRAAPAVALFGLGYDEQFIEVMGEPWPGVREAERQLAREAAASAARRSTEVRRERQERFDTWLAEQTRDQEQARRAPRREVRERETHSAGRNERRIEPMAGEQGSPVEGRGREPTTRSRTWSRAGRTRWVSTSAPARWWRRGRGGKEIQSATQLNAFIPVPVLALHREDHPAAERHRLLPRRRRDRHLRLRHRALRQHVQRRGPPAHGRRPPEPPREAGLAGARGHPPDPGAEGARRRRDPGLLGSRRRSRARSRSSPTTRPPCASTSSPSATAR